MRRFKVINPEGVCVYKGFTGACSRLKRITAPSPQVTEGGNEIIPDNHPGQATQVPQTDGLGAPSPKGAFLPQSQAATYPALALLLAGRPRSLRLVTSGWPGRLWCPRPACLSRQFLRGLSR